MEYFSEDLFPERTTNIGPCTELLSSKLIGSLLPWGKRCSKAARNVQTRGRYSPNRYIFFLDLGDFKAYNLFLFLYYYSQIHETHNHNLKSPNLFSGCHLWMKGGYVILVGCGKYLRLENRQY